MKNLLLFNFLFISIFCYSQIKIDIIKTNGEIININSNGKFIYSGNYKKFSSKDINGNKIKVNTKDVDKIIVGGLSLFERLELDNGKTVFTKTVVANKLYEISKLVYSSNGVGSGYNTKEKLYIKKGDKYIKASGKEVNDHFQCGLKSRKRHAPYFKECIENKNMIKALQNQD